MIKDIKTKDILNWQTQLNNSENAKENKKKLSYQYKDNILTYFKNFFNYCVEIEEILASNPIKKQIKFIETEIKEEMLIYSPEEYKQFRSIISNEQDSIIFDLLYFTGIRKGELLALKWQDLKEKFLSITKTYTRKTKDGKWKLTLPKSKNSIRDVLLPNFLLDRLKEYKKQKQANTSEFIIGSDIPNNEKYLDNARDKYYKLAEVKRIRIHDFRHSHVSFLISENIDIVTIAKRVGDKVETILKTYAHLLPNKQIELINKLDNLMQN